jgi:ubiquinone/menaquinone biosynthesis C-methylase UbiE
MNTTDTPRAAPEAAWDTGSHDDFFAYYAQQSLTPQAQERFRTLAHMLLRVAGAGRHSGPLDVLDIGCGAGAQAHMGHCYRGLDINRPLIELASQRARQLQLQAEFDVGSATELPYASASADICMLPFILEHVAAWQASVDEALRVVRPGGLVFISTTSKLCPAQDEFRLPAYGWYPPPLKRYFERRAVTDWPAVVNHAKYPAVHWFSAYQLGHYLREGGCDETFDRFDVMDTANKSPKVRAAMAVVRNFPPARFLGHVCTPYTLVVGRKAA